MDPVEVKLSLLVRCCLDECYRKGDATRRELDEAVREGSPAIVSLAMLQGPGRAEISERFLER